MSRGLHRLRSTGSVAYQYVSMPQLRRKASHTVSAVKDTYFSAKDIFERHRVILTLATSMATVATGLIGYSLRHLHEARVERRLANIETGLKCKNEIDDADIKKLIRGTVSIPASVATAGTTLFVGYFLGWKGGKWYAVRQFRREQAKLLGQIKPDSQWPLAFLKHHKASLGSRLKLRRLPALKILRRHHMKAESVANASSSETISKSKDVLEKAVESVVAKASETASK